MKSGLIILSFFLASISLAGAELYQGKCLSCHGENGQGIDGQGPKLSGQFDWYLLSQLTSFSSGERKKKAGQNCEEGLSAQDMKDLASYLSSL